jgi:hypothetical protein
MTRPWRTSRIRLDGADALSPKLTSLGFRLAKMKEKNIKNQQVNAFTWVLQVNWSFV